MNIGRNFTRSGEVQTSGKGQLLEDSSEENYHSSYKSESSLTVQQSEDKRYQWINKAY